MTAQPALDLPDLPELVEPDYEPELTIAERYALFHEANPHVYRALEILATQWLWRNRRVGVKALFEQLRWQSGITTDARPYVLDNNFTAHYARALLAAHPEWEGRIVTRALRTP